MEPDETVILRKRKRISPDDQDMRIRAMENRVASFYFGESSKRSSIAEEKAWSPMQRSVSMVTMMPEREAMFSCWKTVHGERHELESSPEVCQGVLTSRHSTLPDLLLTRVQSDLQFYDDGGSCSQSFGFMRKSSIGNSLQSLSEDVNENTIMGNKDTISPSEQIHNGNMSARNNRKYDNLMRQRSLKVAKVQYTQDPVSVLEQYRRPSSYAFEDNRKSFVSAMSQENNRKSFVSALTQSQNTSDFQAPRKQLVLRSNSSSAVVTKTPAYRQSSLPGLRERTLIQNEAKRCSLPLPSMGIKPVLLSHGPDIVESVSEVSDVVRWLYCLAIEVIL